MVAPGGGFLGSSCHILAGDGADLLDGRRRGDQLARAQLTGGVATRADDSSHSGSAAIGRLEGEHPVLDRLTLVSHLTAHHAGGATTHGTQGQEHEEAASSFHVTPPRCHGIWTTSPPARVPRARQVFCVVPSVKKRTE